jgi:hypothetical protein
MPQLEARESRGAIKGSKTQNSAHPPPITNSNVKNPSKPSVNVVKSVNVSHPNHMRVCPLTCDARVPRGDARGQAFNHSNHSNQFNSLKNSDQCSQVDERNLSQMLIPNCVESSCQTECYLSNKLSTPAMQRERAEISCQTLDCDSVEFAPINLKSSIGDEEKSFLKSDVYCQTSFKHSLIDSDISLKQKSQILTSGTLNSGDALVNKSSEVLSNFHSTVANCNSDECNDNSQGAHTNIDIDLVSRNHTESNINDIKNFSEHNTQTHMDVDNSEIPNAKFKCVESTTTNQVDEGTLYSEEPVSDAKTPTSEEACASEIINKQHLVRPQCDVSDYDNESVTSRISHFSKTSDRSISSRNSNVFLQAPKLNDFDNDGNLSCNLYGGSVWITLFVNEVKIHALVDTGSSITVLKHHFNYKVTPSDLTCNTASGDNLKIRGVSVMSLRVGETRVKMEVFVSDHLKDNILGLDFMKETQCVIDIPNKRLIMKGDRIPIYDSPQREMICHVDNLPGPASKHGQLPDIISSQIIKLPPEFQEAGTELLNEFADLFRSEPLGSSIHFEHALELTDETPIKQAPRRVSAAQYKCIEEEIERMLKLGVIRPSKSGWSSPIVMVLKKDKSWRTCVDYRKVNERTKPDAYPIPVIQDILDALQGARYFVTLDMNSGFWQIKMREQDVPKTAFVVPHGHYEFLKMPFGFRNATSTFQRAMTQLLKPLLNKGALVFVDDVTIYAKTIPELMERLRKVFELLRSDNLTLNAKKCVLFATEIEVLSHRVSADGVKMMQDKIESIMNWKEPTNKKLNRSFLGLASHYRHFISNFAKIAAPLHKLTSKSCAWKWSDHEATAFNDLKQVLMEAPVLKLFNPNKPIFIDCDASNYAIGAVLVQPGDDDLEHPVAYFSRCLSKAECNYCVTRRELLSVLEALRKWRHYVAGAPVTIRTDHSSLTWLKSFKNPENQMARWFEELSQYDITLQHRPGSKSGNADALSRRPCPQNCTYCSRRENREQEIHVCNVRIQTEINWEEEQSKDQDVAKMVKWKKEGQKPPWERVSGDSPALKKFWREWDVLIMEGGVLKRVFYKPVGEVHQIVVPRQCRAHILEVVHQQGHFGCLRTQTSLKDRFYWPSWKTDVQKHVNRCIPCAQRKGPHMRPRLPQLKYLSSEPFERIGVDICGPFPITERNNKYLLVVCDYMTKWVEAIPLPNQESVTIADALIREVICRYGLPREIISDQGLNFTSRLIQNICDRFHIKKTKTCPYTPASNGLTERANRWIADALSKIIENQKDWDKLVSLVCFFYRSSQHKATGCSPALLAMGRELKVPVDVMYPTGRIEKVSVPQYIEDLEERLNVAAEFARQRMEMDWESREANSRTWVNYSQIDITKPVYIFNPSVTRGNIPKLSRFWRGPYKVVERLNSHLYKIATGRRKDIQVIHRSHIFQPRDIEDEEVRRQGVSPQ